MSVLYTNGFSMTLTGTVAAGATSFSLPSDPGAALPTLGAGDWVWLTFSDVAQTKFEIIKVTGRSGASLSGITRGDQSTTDQSWVAGDKIELRWTSAGVNAVTEPTGVVKDYIGANAPSGYVLLSGRTIGDASSSATERANADTATLYALLWDNMTNTEAPVSSGRGANAAADFAAHKTITLPDARGRVIAGKDNMGGTTASRLTSGGSGITGTTLGTSGGGETHTLTTAQLAIHNHTVLGTSGLATLWDAVGVAAQIGGFAGGDGVTGARGSASGGNNGSGAAHQNTQPTLVLNKIIKL